MSLIPPHQLQHTISTFLPFKYPYIQRVALLHRFTSSLASTKSATPLKSLIVPSITTMAASNSSSLLLTHSPAANEINGSNGKINGCNSAENVADDKEIALPKKASNNALLSTNGTNGLVADHESYNSRRSLWYEEEVNQDLRWCYSLSSILHVGVSKFQDIALLETRPFGKVLILDGKLQSSEADEFVYHESLVHPAMLYHSSPETVFIMGGGEGSTAREALRHRSTRKVVMCDIDKEVVAFCSAYLSQNKEAFNSSRLELVINDARVELENREDRFDIIIGDLADPVEGGPCYQLYSKSFYEHIVKPRLNPGGILITQAGPAGVRSHGEVFSSIYNTLRHVFKYVVAYTAHIPSFADTWGWVMARDEPIDEVSVEELDERIRQRIKEELRYIDGATIHGALHLNKIIRRTLFSETHIYTEDSQRFVYGRGTNLH